MQLRSSPTTAPVSPSAPAFEFGLVENLSAKVEYDFYDFGSKNYNLNFNAITPVSVACVPNWPLGGGIRGG